jgi:hypothetical protein
VGNRGRLIAMVEQERLNVFRTASNGHSAFIKDNNLHHATMALEEDEK